MAASWLRDKRNVEAGGHSSPRVAAGVVECLLEEVESQLQLRRSRDRAAGRVGSDAVIDEQDQPDYSWLTSAWSPSLTSVSGRGPRDMSCRERWELEQLFREVKAHQCCYVIREFRKHATSAASVQQVTAIMKDIVKATLERQKQQELEESKSKKPSTITPVKILERGALVPSSGGGSAFLRNRVRSMAYALVHSPNSHKIAPDADAYPRQVITVGNAGRRMLSWNGL